MRRASQNPYVGMKAEDLWATLGKTVASTVENRFNPLEQLQEEPLHGDSKMRIMVVFLTTSLVMELEKDATIHTIKENIQKEEGIPAKFQRLVDASGDEVTDMCHVCNGAVLQMVLTNRKKINNLPDNMDLDQAIALCDTGKLFFGRNPEAVVMELPVDLYVALLEYLQTPSETDGAAAAAAGEARQ
jgi:hypothetical protein